MREIIALLQEDAGLCALLGEGRVFVGAVEYLGDCLICDFSAIADDGCALRARLKVSCVCASWEKALLASERVRAVLVKPGDRPLCARLNGGGTLRDEARGMYHRISYFEVTVRSQEGCANGG